MALSRPEGRPFEVHSSHAHCPISSELEAMAEESAKREARNFMGGG